MWGSSQESTGLTARKETAVPSTRAIHLLIVISSILDLLRRQAQTMGVTVRVWLRRAVQTVSASPGTEEMVSGRPWPRPGGCKLRRPGYGSLIPDLPGHRLCVSRPPSSRKSKRHPKAGQVEDARKPVAEGVQRNGHR